MLLSYFAQSYLILSNYKSSEIRKKLEKVRNPQALVFMTCFTKKPIVLDLSKERPPHQGINILVTTIN